MTGKNNLFLISIVSLISIGGIVIMTIFASDINTGDASKFSNGGYHCRGSSSQSCSVSNGIGSQYRTCTSFGWSSWSTCIAISCNSGYTLSNGRCVQSTTDYISDLMLINADTNKDISTLSNGMTIDLAVVGNNINIRTDTVPINIGSIEFVYDGVSLRTENNHPYAFAGDSKINGVTDYLPWTPSLGSHTLKVNLYSRDNLSGTLEGSVKINFNVIKSTTCTQTNNGVEICDGSDNNCNGLIDDAMSSLSQSCSISNGAGTQHSSCTNGRTSWSTCIVSNCNSGYTLSNGQCIQNTVICTGLSSQSCSVGVGACLRTGTQSRTCTNGIWSSFSSCSVSAGNPTTEICGNGVDEDCNGVDLVCTPTSKGTDEYYFNKDYTGVTLTGSSSSRQFVNWGNLSYDKYNSLSFLSSAANLWEYRSGYTDMKMVDNCDSGRRCLRFDNFDDYTSSSYTERTQLELKFKPGTKLPAYHMSQRMYWSPDLANLKQYDWSTYSSYFDVWETWLMSGPFTSTNPAGSARVSMYVVRDPNVANGLRWELAYELMEPSESVRWARYNAAPIPFGQWFTMDFTVVDGYGADGWVYVTITPDGGSKTVLFDVHNTTLYEAKDGTKYPELTRQSIMPYKFYMGNPILDYMRTSGYSNYVLYNDFKWYKNAP